MSERQPRASTPHVRRATAADLPAIERTLGRSFLDDPVWEWVLGRSRTNVKRIGTVMAAFASVHMRDESVWVSDDCEAVAVWAPPKRWRTEPRDFVRHGRGALWALGLRSLPQLAALVETEKVHPREEHWYLAVLGTEPDMQGKGFGAAALAPVLSVCDDQGLPAYLESSKERNVPYYERFGFEVTARLDLARKGPPLWTMWREPRPPDS